MLKIYKENSDAGEPDIFNNINMRSLLLEAKCIKE